MYKRHATLFLRFVFKRIFISAFFIDYCRFRFFIFPVLFSRIFYFGAFVSAVFGHLKIAAVALILVGFLLGILLIAIIPIEKSF